MKDKEIETIEEGIIDKETIEDLLIEDDKDSIDPKDDEFPDL